MTDGSAYDDLAPGEDKFGAQWLKLLYIEDNLSNLRLLECTLARHEGVRFTSVMYGLPGSGTRSGTAAGPDPARRASA